MKRILVVSSNQNIIDTVKDGCSAFSDDFDFCVKTDHVDVISYINYELPEIKVLDFTCETVDCNEILRIIHDDPWLHYGGIMAICADRVKVAELELEKDANILSIQTPESFSYHFSRMLRILWQNQQFLAMHGMQEQIGGEENGSFVCGNDPFDFSFYTMFLVNYLYNTDRINEDDRMNLKVALTELMTNALEHGNLEITQKEKLEWKKEYGDTSKLLLTRAADPKYSSRQLTLIYAITKEKSTFSIRDEGKGFDWKACLSGRSDTVRTGHGIDLVKSLVQNIEYNEKGTQATFWIKNQIDAANTMPSVMKNLQKEHFKDKQILCRQNEMTNDLFFIVAGRFAVYSNRKLVAVLTPADVFIGEMSFLLNDRRSATIMCIGNGTLIRIHKAQFMHLIRKNPHYGLYLSRMLAQRLARQTTATIKLSNQLLKQQGK